MLLSEIIGGLVVHAMDLRLIIFFQIETINECFQCYFFCYSDEMKGFTHFNRQQFPSLV